MNTATQRKKWLKELDPSSLQLMMLAGFIEDNENEPSMRIHGKKFAEIIGSKPESAAVFYKYLIDNKFLASDGIHLTDHASKRLAEIVNQDVKHQHTWDRRKNAIQRTVFTCVGMAVASFIALGVRAVIIKAKIAPTSIPLMQVMEDEIGR